MSEPEDLFEEVSTKDIIQKISTIEDEIRELQDPHGQFEEKTEEAFNRLAVLKDETKKYIDNATETIQQSIDEYKRQKNIEFDTKMSGFESQISSHIKTLNTKLDAYIQESEIILKKSIENQEALFNDNISKINSRHDELFRKIESLLPEATAVGISKAFADEKTSHLRSMWTNQILSYLIIGVIFIVALIFYITSDFNIFSDGIIDYKKFFTSFVRLLAMELPLCWLATLAAKKAHQHQRIYEEYAHKYTSAMTFVGMSKETKINPNLYGSDSIKMLNEGFRDAVFMNPSSTLDKKVDTENPLEKLSCLVKELGKEGVTSLVDSIAKNRN